MLTFGLIDNHVIMRAGLAIIFENHFRNINISESEDVKHFIDSHPNQNPDLLILGNNFAGKQDCLDAVSILKSRFPLVPLIIYDEYLEQDMTILYFKLGVNGYVLKQNNADEMIKCVETVLENKQYLCPVLLERLLKNFRKKNNGLVVERILTPRESEIAKYLSEGMKTSWIAKTLGRKNSTISTIKNNIYKKLNVQNIIQLKKAFSYDQV
jgi:DNA-binding NarL/FixJ family response regulator